MYAHIISFQICCWSAAKLIQEYSSEIANEYFKSFLTHTVITVLLRTRHKGAMENAQEALGVMTQCAFTRPNSLTSCEQRIKIVEEQV